MQTRASEASDASQTSQQQSRSATPLSKEADDSTTPHPGQPSEHGMEKNYTDTIENLLAELWKERLVSACLLLPNLNPVFWSRRLVRVAAGCSFDNSSLLSGNASSQRCAPPSCM